MKRGKQNKTKRISARITPRVARMLAELSAHEESDLSEQIMEAVKERYDRLLAQRQNAWKVFEKQGFIGCAKGPANLSQSYKAVYSKALSSKYGNR